MEEPLKTTASTTDTTNLDDRHPYWFVLLGIAVAFVINALAFLFLRCIDFFSLHGRRKRAYTVGCVIGTVLSVIFWIVIYLVVIRRAIYWVGPTVEEVPINEVTRSPVSALQMF